MEKKKERSSRQKLRVETGQEGGEEDGNLMLANPMAGGEVSPHATVVPQYEHLQPRASLTGKKTRPKSPSLLRFFVRGTRKASEDLEESADCACSDHEDSSSSHGNHSHYSVPEHNTSSDSPIRFNRNVEANVTLPRRKCRVEKRDSGFHSERSDSTSHDKEQHSASPEDMHPSPLPAEEDRPVGMEALEALHNQIQILVKQDCPEEETHLATLHDAVIASLRHQLEDMQLTLDFLRQSDHNLRLTLRDAEHRALEAETKLLKSTERNQRMEHKLLVMAHKYQQLKTQGAAGKPLPPKPATLAVKHLTSSAKVAYYSPQVQRVQREGSDSTDSAASRRPSSAQGTRDPVSQETCV